MPFRRFASVCLAVWLPLCATAVLAANELGSPPRISVSGTAAVRVVPDEAHVMVGVVTRHANLQEATRDNGERVAKAMALIRRHGVAEKDIQLSLLRVEPEYDSSNNRTTPVAYTVHKRLDVRLTQMGNFDPLFTSLYAAGVNQVGDIEFRTTEMRRHRDRARELAVTAAVEKADALTARLGVKRGKAIDISESSSYWGAANVNSRDLRVQNQSSSGAPAESAEGDLAAGQISVTATVSVVFLLE